MTTAQDQKDASGVLCGNPKQCATRHSHDFRLLRAAKHLPRSLRLLLEDLEPLRHRLERPLHGHQAPRKFLRPLGLLRCEGLLRRALLDGLLRLLRLPRLVGLPHGLQAVVEHLADTTRVITPRSMPMHL